MRIAKENPTWGQRRVAAELYLNWSFSCPLEPCESTGPGDETTTGKAASSERWATFVRNHANAIVACEFMVAVTGKFQLLYVFVILELGTRRILQCNVTAHQLRNGHCSNFGKDSVTRPRMVSSSMIVIAFSRRMSIRS